MSSIESIFQEYLDKYYLNANEKYEVSFHLKFKDYSICIKPKFEKHIYINENKFPNIANITIPQFYSFANSVIKDISLNYLVSNVSAYDKIVKSMLGESDLVLLHEYKLLIAGVYKIHLMPKREYFLNVVNRLFRLLDAGLLEIYGMKCLYNNIDDIYQNLIDTRSHGGYYPIITIYCNYGRMHVSNTLYQLIKEFTDHKKIGLNLTPILNTRINELIYYKQGHTDSRVKHDVFEHSALFTNNIPNENLFKHDIVLQEKKENILESKQTTYHDLEKRRISVLWEKYDIPLVQDAFDDTESSTSISTLLECYPDDENY